MKKRYLGVLTALVLLFSACQAQSVETTESTDVAITEAATEAVTEAPAQQTEAATTEAPATEAAATEVQVAQPTSGAQIYAVDFSDVPGIRSLTTGHADDTLLAIALTSPVEEETQNVVLYRVRGNEKSELRSFTIPGPVEKIGAISGDDDDIFFTAVDRTDENTQGRFVIYKIEEDSSEVHPMYEGVADGYNYGQNLVADDDAVAFTENMTESDGYYFADVCLLTNDAKQIVNVEVFPAEYVSLLLDDDSLHYAAARNDQLFIVDYDYEDNETYEYAVEGDNAAFRLTDYDDNAYLLDNYNSHPDLQGAMMLLVNRDGIRAFSEEGRNVHSGIFADDQISAVSTLANEVKWVKATRGADGLEDVSEAAQTAAGTAFTGVFEEDDVVVRYPIRTSEEGDRLFAFQYQVHKR